MRELDVLCRRLELRTRSGGAGDRVGKRRGSSAEFADHRPYLPGDDPRRIDWLALARTGTPVVKTYRAEEDVLVRVLVDASASLGEGEPAKWIIAQRVAAAIAYLGLRAGQRVQLGTLQGELSGAAALERPVRGKTAMARVLRDLSRVAPSGAGDLTRGLDAAAQRGRPGSLVVISDFLDPGDFAAALSRAAARGHDVALVQVLARSEVEPSFEGDLRLVDAETGESVEVTLDQTALDAYHSALEGLLGTLRGFARRHGGSYVRLVSDEALEPAVRRFVARAID